MERPGGQWLRAVGRGPPRSSANIVAAAAALVGMVAWANYQTGNDVSFLIFYAAPVALVGWRVGRSSAIPVALVATVGWCLANELGELLDAPAISLWNSVNRGGLFVFVAILSDLLARESRHARIDALTELPNRRALLERLNEAISRDRRDPSPFCVACLDLDNFKAVNDTFGHPAGDLVLQRVGDAIRGSIRAGDVPARIGGDEFAILFWRIGRADVEKIARRLVTEMVRIGAEFPGTQLGVSIGVAHFDCAPERAEEVLGQADRALYEAKAAGKRQLVVWPSDWEKKKRLAEPGSSKGLSSQEKAESSL